ncbi:hypothetical protein CKM354_000762700 [Cercospora kikuchii]|uniref:Fatty acyl-CoA reductase n=1 Tax=Cercospora kikuchii TaxID=84275 RepID=A0A9P3FIY5_9PEZI|nr:uncharacterized protein CKM354_000762700 [Cercospora kikuchii]GIZ44429.1 hypothetical protein CKM354_000762700 [Cercospora kikuchii]
MENRNSSCDSSGWDLEKILSEKSDDRVNDALQDKVVFLTGATGMLGIALVVKMALDTTIDRIYVLVRGGLERFWTRMRQHLPAALVESLQSSKKTVVMSGDITCPQLGLQQEEIVQLRQVVTIFIHAASTINLKQKVEHTTKDIILPSLEVAKLAISCPCLERFVYVSTAYVNAFLHFQASKGGPIPECKVEERIYPLRNDVPFDNSAAELKNLLEFGTTPEYSCIPHPYAYAYAKHLTERLLLGAFSEAGLEHALMIFRPSIFGPAEREPFPQFEVAGSAPGSSMLAFILASPPARARFACHISDPANAKFDEIPIDIVVNRLLVHIAYGSSGCVHAVSGPLGSTPFAETFKAVVKFRPWWWGKPKVKWCKADKDAAKACFMSKVWMILGCSFSFSEKKTQDLWLSMDDATRANWPLWRSRPPGNMYDWSRRVPNANALLCAFMRKRYGRSGSFAATIIQSKTAPKPVDHERDTERWIPKLP